MKLLFVIVNCEKGGAQRVLLNLTQALKHKHEIELVALREAENPFIFDCPTTVLKSKFKQRFIRFMEYRKQLKELIIKGRYDGVISFLPEPNFLCTSLKHNGFTLINVRNDPNVEYQGMYQILMKIFYPKADGLVVQTDSIKEYFKPLISDIEVIPNAVSKIEDYTIERKSIVLSAGRFVPQKNHHLLIKAFSRFNQLYPEYECHIYGEGKLKKDYETWIKQLNLVGKVKLFEPSHEIFKHMQESELFVLSSNYEGYPNVLLEAMACGCACIATQVPSLACDSIINQNENGVLIPVNHEDALYEALCALQDKEFRSRLQTQALKIRETHAEEQFVRQYTTVIEKVAQKHDKS